MKTPSILVLLFTSLMTLATLQGQNTSNAYFELLQFQGVDVARIHELDHYFEKALVPTLNRNGVENVGVFKESKEEDGKTSMYLLLQLRKPQHLAELLESFKSDSEFRQAAQDYFLTDSSKPLYTRVRSEFLLAFDCMPKLAIPKQKSEKKDRLFELRTYESPNERMGALKVEMFNSGEVPIFLDCGIQPVFFGQALIGDKMPNLTYMTVYNNSEERDAAWKKFREHPEWKKLSGVEKYKGTVSKIHKTDLVPRGYSQL